MTPTHAPPARVLVTGATGLLGAALVARLRGRGATVTALARDPARALAAVPGLARAWPWRAEAPVPPEALSEVDAVVHLAGEPVVGRWTAAKRRAIRDTRVDGTRRLVDALAASPRRPATLVAASAIGLYGERGDEVLTEASPPGAGFLADVCRAWEGEAARARDLGVRVVHLRIGLVLDPAGGALGAMLAPFRLGLGGPLGPGRQWWPWIHRDDLTDLLELALGRDDLDGPLNATAPEPARQADLARALARALGRPAVLPAPSLALRLALGGFSDELLTSRRVHPWRALELGHTFRFPRLEAALADLLGRPRREASPPPRVGAGAAR